MNINIYRALNFAADLVALVELYTKDHENEPECQHDLAEPSVTSGNLVK